MDIYLRPISEADFDFIYDVTKAAIEIYVELTWGSWIDQEQRSQILPPPAKHKLCDDIPMVFLSMVLGY